MKRILLIALCPLIGLLAVLAQRFFTWIERELNLIAMGGR